nr:MAG TPA: hypothetical protein [Caudoviricetes sp.]
MTKIRPFAHHFFASFHFQKHNYKLLFYPTFSYRILRNQEFIFVPMPDDLTFLIAQTGCHQFCRQISRKSSNYKEKN